MPFMTIARSLHTYILMYICTYIFTTCVCLSFCPPLSKLLGFLLKFQEDIGAFTTQHLLLVLKGTLQLSNFLGDQNLAVKLSW